jgi:hypothetical protein
MGMDLESSRATPEGRLWMAVLHAAFRDLERGGEWLATHVPLRSEVASRRVRLRPSGEAPTRQPTRDQLARQLEAVADLVTFFVDDESVMCVVCDALGYDADVVREMAEKIMVRTMMAERMAQARRKLRSPRATSTSAARVAGSKAAVARDETRVA